jgi:UPF0755 protein
MAYYHSKYSTQRHRKKSRGSRFLIFSLLVLIIAAGIVGYLLYLTIFKPNIWTPENKTTEFYIKTGSTFDDIKTDLYSQGIILNRKTFEWLAGKKKLASNIKPGRYLINPGLNNNQLIDLLRSGEQTPLNVVINNIRTKEELAHKVSTQIEADSMKIIKLLNDTTYLKTFGLNTETVMAMFLPNTYELYWTTTAESFMDRMFTEYQKFWNENRQAQANEMGLSPVEVVTLASIIEKETTKNDEKKTMAGVYLNRLKYNWRLQADPTVVFAWGDFSIRRVLNVHKQIDSPYNTYLYYGLPPGPICAPSIASIDAVLNAEDHTYMFFCAKDDFSGYHVFSSTHAGHTINANKYRKALDERNIRN